MSCLFAPSRTTDRGIGFRFYLPKRFVLSPFFPGRSGLAQPPHEPMALLPSARRRFANPSRFLLSRHIPSGPFPRFSGKNPLSPMPENTCGDCFRSHTPSIGRLSAKRKERPPANLWRATLCVPAPACFGRLCSGRISSRYWELRPLLSPKTHRKLSMICNSSFRP